MTFTKLAGKPGGSGYIVGAKLTTDDKTVTARFRVHVFHTAPTQIIDNDPMSLLYADKIKRIDSFDLPGMSTEDATASTGAESINNDLRIRFLADGGNEDLYAMLSDIDGFTPASVQKFYLELTA